MDYRWRCINCQYTYYFEEQYLYLPSTTNKSIAIDSKLIVGCGKSDTCLRRILLSHSTVPRGSRVTALNGPAAARRRRTTTTARPGNSEEWEDKERKSIDREHCKRS